MYRNIIGLEKKYKFWLQSKIIDLSQQQIHESIKSWELVFFNEKHLFKPSKNFNLSISNIIFFSINLVGTNLEWKCWSDYFYD